MKESVKLTVKEALADIEIDAKTKRLITDRVVRKLTNEKNGVFQEVGYTQGLKPKTISPVAITKTHLPVFLVRQVVEQ